MSRPRSAGPGSQETQPYQDQPRGAEAADGARGRRPGLSRLLTGIGLCVVALLFGELVKSGPVARFDLRVDQHIAAHDRTSALTSLAKFATDIAVPETIGIALLFLVPIILFLMRRRLDALKVFCMIGGAYALVEVVKKIVNEPRPPAAVQAVAADHSGSFPSGHATVAAILCVSLVAIAVTLAGRVTALVLGGLYTVAVACSRFYLGDHYLLDVVGSVVCALAAALVVTGLAALPALRPYLRRLEAAPRRRGRRERRA
jgi:membrane-associated phospholipid phosphatase